MLDNHYKAIPALSLCFNYIETDKEQYLRSKTLWDANIKASKALDDIEVFGNLTLNLPLNTRYDSWGETIEWLESNVLKISKLTLDKTNEFGRYLIVKSLDNINTHVSIYFENSDILLDEFNDKLVSKNIGEFIRDVGYKFYHIVNESIYFFFERIVHLNQNISKAKTAKKHTLNMLTLDIETYKIYDRMYIYCVSFYAGETCYSYYITDFNSVEDLMKAVFNKLLSREFNQKSIYIHNSSEFDLIFMLKHLFDLPNIKYDPVIKDGKFINLKVNFGPGLRYYINFKDFLLLLPSSLQKLAKQFNVETQKEIFPHDFVTRETLIYIGEVPSYAYFDKTKVTKEEYLNYCENFKDKNWSLKDEAIRYCSIDRKSLFEVITTFSHQIFEKFSINVSSVSTLPSLAFKIFRAHYLDKNVKLPVLTGRFYDSISQAYYDGHVDMYIPKNFDGELTFKYDVNSLYPSVMFEYKYPSKILAYFRGDITMMDQYKDVFEKNLSVLKVKVTAPEGILHPILPYKHNGSTIYPEGSWTGWYYSN